MSPDLRDAATCEIERWSHDGRRRWITGPLGIVQDIERHGDAAPAETTFDWADEKVIEQLKARLNSDKR
jgi:hypothetical protein